MQRRFAPAVSFAALVLSAACSRTEAPRFGAAERINASTDVGTAPVLAVSPRGAEAAAWISAPAGGSDGLLYVHTAGGTSELRDSLGAIEPHGESPPKLAFSEDGALNALYVVAKDVPGRRFPASALRFVRSVDGGAHWTQPVTVTDDSTFGSHNFHALYAASDGVLYASWLDGRAGKSAVFMTHSTDGGRTWMKNVRVTSGEACPCCRTAMTSGTDGTVYVAWRQVFPGNVRDIVVARSTTHGETWDEPTRVHADNWVFDGCPHAGPSLQTDANGRVHVAWWTGKQGSAGVWYAHTDDRAHTFSSAEPLGVAEFSRPAHVQLALGDGGRVIATWDDGTTNDRRIVARVSANGGSSWGSTVALSDSGRAAAFPVVAIARGRVMVAWSEMSAASAAHAAEHAVNMKDPHAHMPLGTVGDAQVVARRATLE